MLYTFHLAYGDRYVLGLEGFGQLGTFHRDFCRKQAKIKCVGHMVPKIQRHLKNTIRCINNIKIEDVSIFDFFK